MLGNEKILIHFNLSLALVFAQIVFVSSSDAHTSPVRYTQNLVFMLLTERSSSIQVPFMFQWIIEQMRE